MAPRHDNSISPGNYDVSFRVVSPLSNSPTSTDQTIEENSQTSNCKTDDLRDVDEKLNGDHMRFRHEKSWLQRLLHAFKYDLTIDLNSKSNVDAAPKRRRLYKLAAGMILTAVAVAVYKRIDGRRKILLLSLLSHFNISGTRVTNETRVSNSITSNKYNLIHLLKNLQTVLTKFMQKPDYASAEKSSIGLLRAAAQQGMVHRALIGASDIIFNTRDGWKRASLPPRSPELMSDMVDLLSKSGCNDISTLPDSFWEKAATPMIAALPFIYLAFAYRVLKGLQNGSDGDGKIFFLSKLLSTPLSKRDVANGKQTSFSDIAGLDSILPEVKEIVSYIRNPAGFHALGAEPPRGILLFGSPGVGKTMIAKAIAGEAECDAFCVCSGSDFCEMYVGRGAGRVRSLFKEARKSALNNYNTRRGLGRSRWRPWGSVTKYADTSNNRGMGERPATAIIFIDELDAVAKSRSYGGFANSNDERDQTLNQLLTEMDGFNRSDQGDVIVIVVAATNRAEILDPAILRRFDRQICVPSPNKKGRMEILKVHAAKTRCRFSTIHWEYLAEETPNFSGSDLKQVVNDAALLAVRQQSKQIEQGHLLQSIQRARTMKIQSSTNGKRMGYSSMILA